MLGLLDAAVSLGGILVAPVFDFLKKKFIPAENDTPERTMGTLATTKPDVLPEYVSALSTYQEALVKFFNRDVIGEASRWVVNLRASIRPVGVIISFVILLSITTGLINNLDGVRLSCEAIISSWFGNRITIK